MVSDLAAGKPLLTAGDYSEVHKGLKLLLADPNVSVVASAIRAIGSLASPLGREYTQHAKKVPQRPHFSSLASLLYSIAALRVSLDCQSLQQGFLPYVRLQSPRSTL